MRAWLAMLRVLESKVIAAHLASMSFRRSETLAKTRKPHKSTLLFPSSRNVRKPISASTGRSGAKAPGPVAIIAQTIRLRDHRKTNDPRNQTQPYLRIASADLGREARDGESCPRTDRDHHCEERRRRRRRLSKSSRTHQAVARGTPKAAET